MTLLNTKQDDLADYVFLFDHETEWHRSEDDQIVIQNRSRKLSLGKLISNYFRSSDRSLPVMKPVYSSHSILVLFAEFCDRSFLQKCVT